MTQYGDNQEPGIITDLTSSASVPTAGSAPNNLGIVGQADLAKANSPADTSKVYQVTRASKAVEWFGPQESSLLTTAIIDALNEGAYPVYAVAAETVQVTNEDHSSVSTTTVNTDNAPLRENAGSITVTLDGTGQDVNVVYDDVSTYSPDAGECYVNPVLGELEINSTPSSSLELDYHHFDYPSAVDVMANLAADELDFLLPLSEHQAVVEKANVTVSNLEQEYNLAMALGGADIFIDPDNPSGFVQSFDDSRTQLVYGTRFEDGSSALAAYAGLKASLGLATTPINQRLTTNKRLHPKQAEALDRAGRGSLNDLGVVPLADEARGVRITDDPTTVSETNTDEQNLKYGFNRLVADYIIETTRDNQRPFIGKLNSQTVRNTLEGLIDQQLTELQQSGAVISYNVSVLKDGPTTAGLEMSVDLVEPLRFIDNTITIGNGA